MKSRTIKKLILYGYNGIPYHLQRFSTQKHSVTNKEIQKILFVMDQIQASNLFESSCYLSELLEYMIYQLVNPDISVFKKYLLHPDCLVRILALEGCEEWDIQKYTPKVLDLIENDPDKDVRKIAIRCFTYLMRHDPNTAISTLSKLEKVENHLETDLWYGCSFYKLGKIDIHTFINQWPKLDTVRMKYTMKNLLQSALSDHEDTKIVSHYFASQCDQGSVVSDILIMCDNILSVNEIDDHRQ